LENKWSAGVAMEEIPCIDDNWIIINWLENR
jgi:hypothetical protein